MLKIFFDYTYLNFNNATSTNYLSREWWFTYFKYFEKNVRGPVPRQYEWPLPWPRQLHSKLPNREITEQLIRKKSEHNELMISTLEELSLHQEDIEKIEHIHDWCRELKILLLQSNLISRIENLNKLKKLEYLNLALNNVEVIENLEMLESLNKLDLTLNFIGDLRSVENLRENYNLRELFLIGNPCADYPGYRNYISDRLHAKNNYDLDQITKAEAQNIRNRNEQKVRVIKQRQELQERINRAETEEEKSKIFWDSKTENCPESRVDIALQHRKAKKLDEEKPKKETVKPRLFASCGRPYNLNQAKLEFELKDEIDRYELNLHIYKHLDTSLIAVDLEVNYVRVTVKNKIFQLALGQEIKADESSSKRSQITGDLLIIMPKLNYNEFDLKLKEKVAQKALKLERKELKGVVDIKNIVKEDLDDVPDLVLGEFLRPPTYYSDFCP
uniref:Dynein axonemal assembly factor 11-like CS domain-containing protein n=1 Tax=Megaselia scalaris TaxID=36166 RepID=T1GHC5_MEGSC